MYKLSITFILGMASHLMFTENIKADNLFQFFEDKYYLETNFIQTTSVNSKDRQITGKIYATRSGNFKIEYLDPIKEIISADDSFLYKLDIELEQLDIVPREQYFKDTPINIFITEIENLSELYGVESCLNDGEFVICSIKIKDEDSFVEKLFLKFYLDELTELSYLDSFGQSVSLKFDQMSWEKFNEEKLFIQPPEGIDVVYH